MEHRTRAVLGEPCGKNQHPQTESILRFARKPEHRQLVSDLPDHRLQLGGGHMAAEWSETQYHQRTKSRFRTLDMGESGKL